MNEKNFFKPLTQLGTMANSKQQGKEKEMTASVTNVYLHVVEDVINNVRADFQSEGVDDIVLNELQAVRWLCLVFPPSHSHANISKLLDESQKILHL